MRLKNRDLKIKVEVIGLDELMDKLKELQNLLQEINNGALVVTAAYQDNLESTKSPMA